MAEFIHPSTCSGLGRSSSGSLIITIFEKNKQKFKLYKYLSIKNLHANIGKVLDVVWIGRPF